MLIILTFRFRLLKIKPMKLTKQLFALLCTFVIVGSIHAQDYFFKNQGPFNASIPTPEEFLGYPIGKQHTRHDLTKLGNELRKKLK